MKKIVLVFAAIWCLMLSISLAEDLEAIETDLARSIAKGLIEQTDKIQKPQIKIDADVQRANGIHVPGKVGIIIVPQKDLKEGEELAEKFKSEKGASLGYLFMYHIVPVINGKAIDANQLRSVTIADGDGKEHKVHVLLLAVKQMADDDYRLQAYGVGDQVLLDAKFSEASGSATEPVTVAIHDRNESTRQGKLAVTVFGKYQAGFQCAHDAE